MVRVRFPPTVDAAISRAVVPLSIVALPEEPVVLNVTALARAFVASRVIVALLALVVNEEVPVTVRLPLSVIFPVVAVAVSAPVTVDAAKFNPASFTIVAAPLPFVVKATVPSTCIVPTLITPLLSSVVAEKLPPTTTLPLSVIPDA